MKKARRRLLAVGTLAGFFPISLHFIFVWTETLHMPSQPYVLYWPLISTVLLLTEWARSTRSKENESFALSSGLLLVAAGTAALGSAASLSFFIGYSDLELFAGERYSLLLGVLATAVASGFQALVAVAEVLLVLVHKEIGTPGVRSVSPAILALVLIIPAGTGVIVERVAWDLRPTTEHLTTGIEYPILEIPGAVDNATRTLRLPNGSAEGLYAISSGLLLQLDDGVMAVDPVTNTASLECSGWSSLVWC